MAKIVAFYYSQTGQGLQILQSVSKPLIETGNEVILKEIVPETSFPFPWTAESFFQAFPESRQGIGCPVRPIDLSDAQDAALVIIVYPTWFLSPSIPTHGFFQDPAIQEFLKDKQVLTIDGCRNMWVMSHTKVLSYIEQNGGKLVGHIVLQDRNPNLVSVITIIRWLFGGKKGKSGIFPAAGVSPEDIKQASVFGSIVAESIASFPDFQILQENLMENGAINYKPHIVFVEKTGHRMFGLFSKWVLKKGTYNAPQRRSRLKVFQYYLFAVLYLVSPIGLLFFFLAYPFNHRAIWKDKLLQCYFK
ncbi:dialkylrecorsinol condensing protein DarA [Bacteroidia bacterium]|nr:dialkylrecorsinol condensing protein DarA [Bacteroidia bacterium]